MARTILGKGAVHLITEKEFSQKLQQKPLRVKYGADPTSSELHLGHAVILKKLRQFQTAGHIVVFIVGDFTAHIGDPSGQNKTRPLLTKEAIEQNAKTYLDQVFTILDKSKTEIVYNSQWLAKLTPEEIVRIAARITVARLLERDDFEKRLNAQKPISFHELLYPLFQAYDSVQVRADVEVGGTDQYYNLLLGRDLQQAAGQSPQIVLTLPLLVGTDGQRKMSKSYGNAIGITDPAQEMFAKIMSLPDALMKDYFLLLTEMTEKEWQERAMVLKTGELNPMQLKKDLAFEITQSFHSQTKAKSAADYFQTVFSDRKIPENLTELRASAQHIWICKLLKEIGFASSHSEARRLVQQNAVKINGEPVTQSEADVDLQDGDIIQAGKRKIAKLRID